MIGISNAFEFTELAREEAVVKCKALAAADHAWHIHALHPDCLFNPRPDSYCFVVEDTDNQKTWCAFSNAPFTSECQELVQLLHGDTILDATHSEHDASEATIVRSAAEALAQNEAWHHHMMKPGCILSPAPDKHVITLERAGRQDIETLVSGQAPDDVLREIELMYFKQNA